MRSRRRPKRATGLDIILDLFMVEREAADADIVGTRAISRCDNAERADARTASSAWMKKMAPLFEPKSPMGEALRYMKNQWARLRVFLDDPLIPIHNNASEAALRIVALVRKNSLFFGNEHAGRRFMTLYSLIATCERHDVNPEVYLADVLIRFRTIPPIGSPNSCRTGGRRPSAPASPSRGLSRHLGDAARPAARSRSSTSPRYARFTLARAPPPEARAAAPPNPPGWPPLRRAGLDRRTIQRDCNPDAGDRGIRWPHILATAAARSSPTLRAVRRQMLRLPTLGTRAANEPSSSGTSSSWR